MALVPFALYFMRCVAKYAMHVYRSVTMVVKLTFYVAVQELSLSGSTTAVVSAYADDVALCLHDAASL